MALAYGLGLFLRSLPPFSFFEKRREDFAIDFLKPERSFALHPDRSLRRFLIR
jgi:hypothetical protein